MPTVYGHCDNSRIKSNTQGCSGAIYSFHSGCFSYFNDPFASDLFNDTLYIYIYICMNPLKYFSKHSINNLFKYTFKIFSKDSLSQRFPAKKSFNDSFRILSEISLSAQKNLPNVHSRFFSGF